MFSVRV